VNVATLAVAAPSGVTALLWCGGLLRTIDLVVGLLIVSGSTVHHYCDWNGLSRPHSVLLEWRARVAGDFAS
jgi:hypothetical protein